MILLEFWKQSRFLVKEQGGETVKASDWCPLTRPVFLEFRDSSLAYGISVPPHLLWVSVEFFPFFLEELSIQIYPPIFLTPLLTPLTTVAPNSQIEIVK